MAVSTELWFKHSRDAGLFLYSILSIAGHAAEWCSFPAPKIKMLFHRYDVGILWWFNILWVLKMCPLDLILYIAIKPQT